VDNSVRRNYVKSGNECLAGGALDLDEVCPLGGDCLSASGVKRGLAGWHVLALESSGGDDVSEEDGSEALLVLQQGVQGVRRDLVEGRLVGAKTVKGPSPARVSARPAADTAASRVENSGAVETSSAMFC